MDIVRLKGTAWLVHDGRQGVIVDTGIQGGAKHILAVVGSLGIRVPLVFLTHTHFDHAGNTQALLRATGAQVLVGASEASCLRSGFTPVPGGTNAVADSLSRTAHDLGIKKLERYEPVTQGIVTIEQACSLEPYGFDARATPLGAHTSGSLGLHIGDWFFAGDTVFGIGGIIYPVFADFEDDIPAAWKKIIDSGARYVCPGHGPKMDMAVLSERYHARFGVE